MVDRITPMINTSPVSQLTCKEMYISKALALEVGICCYH